MFRCRGTDRPPLTFQWTGPTAEIQCASFNSLRAIARRKQNGDVLVIGRNVDEASEISHVVGQALALGLLPALCLCLLAGGWLSVRAQKRVEEVNQRVQRIIAGDLRERLPHRNLDDPFSKLAAIVNGMLDEMETMINALAGVGSDIATICGRR